MSDPTELFGEHTGATGPSSAEIAAWNDACGRDSAAAYAAFIDRYPASPYASEAYYRIQSLNADYVNGNAPAPAAKCPPTVITGRGTTAFEPTAEQPAEPQAEDLGPLTEIYDDVDALRAFVANNPEGEWARRARRRINELRLEQRNVGIGYLRSRINAIQGDTLVIDKPAQVYKEITAMLDNRRLALEDLLNAIATDHNFLHAWTVSQLVRNGYIELDTLTNLGIDRRFVWALSDDKRTEDIRAGRDIDRINKVSTEVYFWGIPSSGKSCALGAIMSMAASGTIARVMEKDNDCQGYGYMTRLAGLFRTDGTVGTLPPSTPVTATYEMAFDLYDDRGRVHPITCIDLAGELVRCMYKNDAGEALSEDEVKALDTVTRILSDNRSRNRKMHFFVLEYGGEERVYEGLRQADYLNGALQYIRRTNIFRKDTDAIFIIVTKVDKTGMVGAQLVQELRNYIDTNYRGFYNGLQQICRENEINGGVIERIPFTLGEVCFQSYCLFNPRPASKIVEIILNRAGGFRTGKKGFFERLFKG